MNSVLEQLMKQSNPLMDTHSRVREAMQRITLNSLSDSGFFDKVAFVGGTALSLFHGLDRSSEDLDFTLLEPDPDFTFGPYIGALESFFESLDLQVEVTEKEKTHQSKMKTAFVKGICREIYLSFGEVVPGIQDNQRISVKLEMDVGPPEDYGTEWAYPLLPFPHKVRMYDLPTLHSCKLHAILCRGWGNRVKGRDYYDILFYSANNIPVNTKHLMERLALSGIEVSGEEEIKELLKKRYASVDYLDAVSDVAPFAFEKRKLQNWSPELFTSTIDRIRFI